MVFSQNRTGAIRAVAVTSSGNAGTLEKLNPTSIKLTSAAAGNHLAFNVFSPFHPTRR
jgi:hypothetical protein